MGQQSAKATLTGTVADPAGAVVPGVTVTATNIATGVSRETVSNGEGLYVLADLPTGDYELKVQATGFMTKTTKVPVPLRVGQTVTLNVGLKIGLVLGEAVDLNENQIFIDERDSLVQSVIDLSEVQNLPLNGRNFLELALLIPGNALAPNFDPTKTNTVVISSAGQLGRGGNVTNVLGASNVNYSGFNNVLVRDSSYPSNPGFNRSSSFGQPVTTADGVFGTSGPRAFQFAARITF